MGIPQTFSINADEIVRGEYFFNRNEPELTFNPSRRIIYVNAACLKRLPDVNYVLFIISSSEKRLILYPCGANERDAILIRSAGVQRNSPRYIRCHDNFLSKILTLMQWDRECRYKMLGCVAKNNNKAIIAFDLTSACYLQQSDGFGIPFDEHQNRPLIKTFSQDTELIVQEGR